MQLLNSRCFYEPKNQGRVLNKYKCIQYFIIFCGTVKTVWGQQLIMSLMTNWLHPRCTLFSSACGVLWALSLLTTVWTSLSRVRAFFTDADSSSARLRFLSRYTSIESNFSKFLLWIFFQSLLPV